MKSLLLPIRAAEPCTKPIHLRVKDVPDELDNKNKTDSKDDKENVQFSIASLHQLSSLETETLSTEIHLLGQLRDRLSPAARYAGNIQTKYRRMQHKTEAEYEQGEYLMEGFPFVERGKPLTGLLVIDRYSIEELEPGKDDAMSGHYRGERVYLTYDRKWIFAERVGAYSGTKGSTSEWEATCRIVTDRSLLEHYSMDVITDGLFEATNKLWEKLSPRMEALKKRTEKAQQVTSKLEQLKTLPKLKLGYEVKEPSPPEVPEKPAAVSATIGKVRTLGRP